MKLLALVLLPSLGLSVDISSCCSHILLASTGLAREHQAAKLGEYLIDGVYEDRPVYRQVQGRAFLFYAGLWIAGSVPNIHHLYRLGLKSDFRKSAPKVNWVY